MSDLYRPATHDEVEQAIRGKGPAIRLPGSTRVVRVEPVGTLTVRRRMQGSGGVLVEAHYYPLPTTLPDGEYLIVEADDE